MADVEAIAKQACAEAVAAGAESADVVVGRGKNLSLDIERGRIKSSDASWGSWCSVRAIVKGGIGWASAPGADAEAARTAARQAAELAALAEPDPAFVSLPRPEERPEVEGLYDERVAELTIDDLVGMCLSNVESARSVEPSVIVTGGAYCGRSESVLVNSLGVCVHWRSTYVSTSIDAVVRRGDDVGTFYDYDSARVMEDFDPNGLGARATQVAVGFLGARKIPSGTMALVFGPLASGSIGQAIASAASAEEVQRNRSFLAGKRGERIASDLVTLVDDPFIPRGMSSGAYDGEGAPRTKLTLVERGILKAYYHNSYTAGKAGEPNTGHGTRGGVSPTNVIPELGDRTAAEIIADTANGLYLNAGWASPNMVNGDLSVTVDFGTRIEDGQLTYPVKNTMFGGNFLDLLRNIDAISSDCRREPGQVLPTLRVRDVLVAGGG